MQLFEFLLVLAALLCGLVAGFLLAFAIVAMPGLGTLGDREFLSGFRAMDRIIQNRQPLFMLVWVGSVAAVIATVVAGWQQVEGASRLLLVGAGLIYVLGVQLPTATINIPLNNQLQAIELDTMAELELANARQAFEPRWNRWNAIRTVLAMTTTVFLLILIALT